MTKTTAPDKTPSPTTPETPTNQGVATSQQARKQFYGAALNMSWQLAVVVLVPIVGGYQLDKALDSVPFLTVVGFFIAMAGTAVVMWRQLQLFTPKDIKEASDK
jgi:F0F1-type ATP synthase assembly protein I